MDHNAYNDDDDFLGDDFDGLPANTLQDLEYQAILSTQRQANSIAPAERQAHAQNARQSITNRSLQPPHRQEYATAGADDGADGSEYGFDNEDVINLDEPSAIYDTALRNPTGGNRKILEPQPTLFPQKIGTIGQPYELAHRSSGRSNSQHLSNGHAKITEAKEEASTNAPTANDFSSLRKRIEELERERTTLQKTAEDAKSNALSKAGEIAIVRSNHDKASKEYERRLAVIQKLHAEELEKQKREVEIARKDREKVETTNKFLEHDLAQEADRARQNRKTLQDRPVNIRYQSESNRQSPAVTPKRGKIAPLRDGFGDDEVIVVSPSKSKQKSKPATPTARGKRKRAVENSPAQPLDIDEPPDPLPELPATEPAPPPAVRSDLSPRTVSGDERFKFLQRVMNHRPSENHTRTFEALTQYKFPSEQESTLSSQFHDKLAIETHSSATGSFPLDFCRILASLWRQCIDEKLYTPIYLLIDLIQFIFNIESVSPATSFVENIVPVVIATVDLVALPIAKAWLDPSYNLPQGYANLTKEINVSASLQVLITVAELSSLSPGIVAFFWQQMEFDFVLLMLHKVQPLPQVMLMLRLLATSPLKATFGAICHEATTTGHQQQQTHETALLDRLTSLLIDKPQEQDEDEDRYSQNDILELRLEVLDVLLALSLTRHGTKSLARHRYAVGRLVRFLQDAVNNLYFLLPPLDPPSSQSSLQEQQSPTINFHSLTTRSINLTTRLLHHILLPSDFNPVQVNIREKLAVIHGGDHKFYVALSRLAFSEQMVLEAGIEDATVDAAHSILDSILSPGEGEAFLKVFESPTRSA